MGALLAANGLPMFRTGQDRPAGKVVERIMLNRLKKKRSGHGHLKRHEILQKKRFVVRREQIFTKNWLQQEDCWSTDASIF